MRYLARYATTEAGVRAVLNRRIDRWARATAAETEAIAPLKQAAREIAARLVATGLIDDTDYAQTRAAGLLRSGRSSRAVAAKLAAKGIGAAQARVALPDDPDVELHSALVLARKRRIGPFRRGETPDLVGKRKEMAMLARAGFPQAIAARALAMEADEAEARIVAFRR